MTDQTVHVYQETREIRLQRLIYVLWNHLTAYQQSELGPGIVKAGMGWALSGTTLDHHDDDDWLTVDQLAYELGLTPSAIRNWQQRYSLKPLKGKYRWGDIEAIRRERQQRRQEGNAAS